MFVLLGLWMWWAVAAREVVGEGEDYCAPYANGCSTPLHIPLLYKSLLTPACNRHDVCYRCGAKYGFSKDACDSAFLQDMEARCVIHDASRRHISLQSSSSSSHLEKKSACTVLGKNLFYMAVRLFGRFFYNGVGDTKPYCSEPAAVSCLPTRS